MYQDYRLTDIEQWAVDYKLNNVVLAVSITSPFVLTEGFLRNAAAKIIKELSEDYYYLQKSISVTEENKYVFVENTDFSSLFFFKENSDWRKVCEDEINFDFNLSEKNKSELTSLIRIIFIRNEDEYHFVFNLSHVICDGLSASALVLDFVQKLGARVSHYYNLYYKRRGKHVHFSGGPEQKKTRRRYLKVLRKKRCNSDRPRFSSFSTPERKDSVIIQGEIKMQTSVPVEENSAVLPEIIKDKSAIYHYRVPDQLIEGLEWLKKKAAESDDRLPVTRHSILSALQILVVRDLFFFDEQDAEVSSLWIKSNTAIDLRSIFTKKVNRGQLGIFAGYIYSYTKLNKHSMSLKEIMDLSKMNRFIIMDSINNKLPVFLLREKVRKAGKRDSGNYLYVPCTNLGDISRRFASKIKKMKILSIKDFSLVTPMHHSFKTLYDTGLCVTYFEGRVYLNFITAVTEGEPYVHKNRFVERYMEYLNYIYAAYKETEKAVPAVSSIS